jgi:predicted transcriptional regulator
MRETPRRVTAQGDPMGHPSMKAARHDNDVVMATPRSVRLSDDVLRRLADLAGRRGTSVSSTIERLLDEALRREAHPGVTFRDGPSGRRAGLVGGPDVDEVIRTLRAVQEQHHEDVVAAVAEMTSLTEAQVRAAVAYYADHRSEVDARIAANERAAEELQAAWRRQQEVLAGPAQ